MPFQLSFTLNIYRKGHLMARPLRVEYYGAYYHVINRGNAGENIFIDERDKEKFLEYLAKGIERFTTRIHAYCLMSNHYHLLIETPQANLSIAIQWLNDEKEIPQLKELKPTPPINTIIQSVCDEFGCNEDQVKTRGRKDNKARAIAMYLARDLSGASCKDIGAYFIRCGNYHEI